MWMSSGIGLGLSIRNVEYHKCGATHTHIALWCSNMPPDVVTAEMSRHEEDDQFTKVARSYLSDTVLKVVVLVMVMMKKVVVILMKMVGM